jgi:hypothetical protein
VGAGGIIDHVGAAAGLAEVSGRGGIHSPKMSEPFRRVKALNLETRLADFLITQLNHRRMSSR